MKLRQATFEDFKAIMAVCARNGLSVTSFDKWTHLWADNPFYQAREGFPIGWVLEDDDAGVVGTLSNIPMEYELNGQRLLAAVASSYAVDREHRNSSLRLALTYVGQSKVDLWMSATANLSAGQVYAAMKLKPMPQPYPDQITFWICGYLGFAGSALHKKKVWGAGGLRFPLGAALWCKDLLRRRIKRPDAGKVGVVESFDSRFDAFWDVLRQRPNRLRAVRDRAALAWHFKSALLNKAASILVLEESGHLVGYLVLVRRDDKGSGLRRYHIVDLQVSEDGPQQAQALALEAMRLAREEGVHVVELMGFNALKHRWLEPLRPRRRQLGYCPFFYKLKNPAMFPALDQPEAWDPCWFDGDASLS